MVFVRIFSIVFSFIKKLQTRSKQCTNKKLSLPGDIIIYTLEDLVVDKKYSTFLTHFVFLKIKHHEVYEAAYTTRLLLSPLFCTKKLVFSKPYLQG